MSPRLVLVAVAVSCLIAAPRAVRAEATTSLTIEPLYLVLPMVDATLEYSPTPHLGLALTAGYAKIAFTSTMYDLGARANVYVRDNFKGPHLGTQLRELWGDSDFTLLGASRDQAMKSSSVKIAGVYGGYKWIGRWGLTAVVQLGVGRMTTSSTDQPRSSQVMPIANLEAGYSW